MDTNRLHYSEITLKATFHHTPETVRRAFGLIAEKKVRGTDYITGEAPLSRLHDVLRHMLNRNGGYQDGDHSGALNVLALVVRCTDREGRERSQPYSQSC